MTLNRDTITLGLNSNPQWVERAMVCLYNRQTEAEKATGETVKHNGVGFSGAHSLMGTYYAKWVLAGNRLNGKHLEKARCIALKYTGQLLDEALKKTQIPA